MSEAHHFRPEPASALKLTLAHYLQQLRVTYGARGLVEPSMVQIALLAHRDGLLQNIDHVFHLLVSLVVQIGECPFEDGRNNTAHLLLDLLIIFVVLAQA